MSSVTMRKLVLQIEEIRHEGGPPPARPPVRGAVLAVIDNPFAGRYVEDIQPFMALLRPLGRELAERLLAALGGEVDAYGKGAIVGALGEIEHGALWHAPGGWAMREVLGGAKAIVPSAKTVGPPGARLAVPITHKDASYVRSHFDAMEVGVPDAPRAGEMVLILVMARGGRVHARSGGLRAEEIEGRDGLR